MRIALLACLLATGCQTLQGVRSASPPATPATITKVCRIGTCTQSAPTNVYGYAQVLPQAQIYFDATHAALLEFHVAINFSRLQELAPGESLDRCHPDGCVVLNSIAIATDQTQEKVTLILPDKLAQASTVIAVVETQSLNTSLPVSSQVAGTHLLLGTDNPSRSTNPVDDATRSRLMKLRTLARGWAVSCPDGSLTDIRGLHCAGNTTTFGDMTLFSGISCRAGETARCNEVQHSQGRNGRWWRNPNAVDHEAVDAFSRDATTGLLNYFLSRPSITKPEASTWMNWVDGSGLHVCTTGSDTRCWMYPDTWALTGQVMNQLGVNLFLDDQISMTAAIASEDPMWATTAETTSGYPQHLIALSIWARRATGMEGKSGTIAQVLAGKQPLNPFFRFIEDGGTQQVAEMVLAACPATDPMPSDALYDWAWQRDDASHRWLVSMGWDCIFMVNLLAGPGMP